MDGEVSWVLELGVKTGQLESFRSLMEEMVVSTRDEAGGLAYQWFVSDDGTAVHIYERYASSAAVMEHLQSFGAKFAERFLAAVDPTRFVVYGTPSDEVRAGLSAFGPTYLGPFGGFVR
jgi:quinol monooxygenase YgiN